MQYEFGNKFSSRYNEDPWVCIVLPITQAVATMDFTKMIILLLPLVH